MKTFSTAGTAVSQLAVLFLIVILVTPSSLLAADDETAAATTAPSPGSAALVDETSALEAQIASLLRQRNATSTASPLLDFHIDLKILERWLLQCAADAGDNDAVRDTASLRVTQLQSAGDLLLQRVGSNKLSIAQNDAFSKLHQFTFKLPQLKSVAAMDEACKSIALDLLLASEPTQAEAKNLPQMRPTPAGDSSHALVEAEPLAELKAKINDLRVSDSLRAELQRVAASSASARDDKELKETLSTAIGLAQVLQSGAGIDPSTRPKIEQQLGDALVLYGDARTRDAGKSRVAALDQYRRSLAGVQSLKIPPALQPRLAPALVFAANSIEHGAQLIGWIGQYIDLCARYDAVATPSAAQRRVLEPLQKKFTAERATFLEDAQVLSSSSSLASLENHLSQMKKLLGQIDQIAQLPHALQVLAAFHIRPGGALERRANLAMSDLSGPRETGKDQALRLIADIVHLAQLAEEISGQQKNIPADVVTTYTRGHLTAVEARRATLVADLGTTLAAGKSLDKADFNKLQTLKDLLDALPEAAAFEQAMAKVEMLNRWADWSISADRLRKITDPYREATAAAFDGFATDNSTPIGRWPVIHQMYAPLLAFVTRDAQYADQCEKFPTGLFDQIAKLMTPMNERPFKTERFASFATEVWAHDYQNADYTSANSMIDVLITRLKSEH